MDREEPLFLDLHPYPGQRRALDHRIPLHIRRGSENCMAIQARSQTDGAFLRLEA